MPRSFTVAECIEALRNITHRESEAKAVIASVRPLAERLAMSDELGKRERKTPDPEQGFGFDLLHEEPDHTLVAAILTWLPGRITPPHDHGTWGVIAGIEGEEINTFWRRTDDGSQPGRARVEKESEIILTPGSSLVLMPRTIHSIENRSDGINVSLHIYGMHINHTERSQFDPERETAEPWKIKE